MERSGAEESRWHEARDDCAPHHSLSATHSASQQADPRLAAKQPGWYACSCGVRTVGGSRRVLLGPAGASSRSHLFAPLVV